MISWNKPNIANCLKLVIELYKEQLKNEGKDAAVLKTMAEGLNEFLQRLSPMIGDAVHKERKRAQKNQERNYSGTAELKKGGKYISCWINGNTFDVGINDIRRFTYLMEMLKKEISDQTEVHFNFVGIEENTHSSFGISPNDMANTIKSPSAISEINVAVENSGNDKPSISISARKGLLVSDNRSVLTDQEQTITVDAVSQWATALISGYLRDFNEEKPDHPGDGVVQSIYHRSWTSLWELVRSIFVTYYAAFGDFSRLKICKECGKLFYEKRSGRKDFCSTLCRVKHNQAGENPDKLKCRMRQNAWARNRLARLESSKIAYTVIKDECDRCTTDTQNGGHCEIILKKNEKALKI